jgi:hypothetical protein
LTTTENQRILSVGPWQNGMDQLDDNIFISDEVVESAVNLLFDDFGIPGPRAGLMKLLHKDDVYGFSNALFVMLGIYRNYSQPGKVYAVIQVLNSLGNQIFYVGLTDDNLGVSGVLWKKSLSNLHSFCKILQYNSQLYLVPTADGISVGLKCSDPAGLTYTTVPTMPRGHSAFILRDRLFIVNKVSSRVYYSKATDFETWSSPDGGFFDINPNDGEPITSVVVNNNNIYIFKLTRTWAFGFVSDPAVDGVLSLLNQDEGAIDSAEYNGTIYLLTRNGVYQFNNGNYIDIGRPVLNALYINKAYSGTGIFVLGKYLYVYTGRDLQTIWAMNLATKAWSKLIFPLTPRGNMLTTIFGRPVNLEGTPYIIGSSGYAIWKMNFDGTAPYDTDQDNIVWSPNYYLRTKKYVINTYFVFKKFVYMTLYSRINLDYKDSPFTLILHPEAEGSETDLEKNVSNTQYYSPGKNVREFIRAQFNSARFNGLRVAVDKPLTELPGVQIDSACRAVGAQIPSFSIKQLGVVYTSTGANMADA